MLAMRKPRLAAVAVLVIALGAGACAKVRPRTTPTPPPPPPVLAAAGLPSDVQDWPPALDPAPVSAWLAEVERAEAEPPTPRQELRERRVEPPDAKPPVGIERLGTPETADAAAATKRVLDTVARARAALASVRVERLTGDARVQYQTAQQLIDQAEAAIKVANFMYALRLADKAEVLAKGLAGGDGSWQPAPVTDATSR
jgi:hypothetical protein